MCESPSQKHETSSLKREPPLRKHEPTNNIKIILFSYYYENSIIVILLEVHAFESAGVHDKGAHIKRGSYFWKRGFRMGVHANPLNPPGYGPGHIYCRSLFHAPFNNSNSIKKNFLCKNPGNDSPLVTKNGKLNI